MLSERKARDVFHLLMLINEFLCQKNTFMNLFSASWKWAVPILVGLLLIGGGIVLCFFLDQLEKLNDSHAGVIVAYCFALMVVLTGIVLIVLKLLKLFADNLEKERLVIAELYVDTQRRQIAENGKNMQEEITRLKKELEEERLVPPPGAPGGGAAPERGDAGAGGEPPAGAGGAPAPQVPAGALPAVLRGVRGQGDRGPAGPEPRPGEHPPGPGQGQAAGTTGRELLRWITAIGRSWTGFG